MRVLLIHGMGRTPLSLLGLAASLRRAGHAPSLAGYVSWAQGFDDVVRRVELRLTQWEREAVPYACVGHSLGGLVLRAALGAQPIRFARHLLLLGTPSRTPRLALRFGQQVWYRRFNGGSGQRLTDPDFFAQLPLPAVPCTVVAGTRGNPLTNRLFPNAPNDGIVAVDETILPEPTRQIMVPVGHTFMMNDARVRHEIHRALALAPA